MQISWSWREAPKIWRKVLLQYCRAENVEDLAIAKNRTGDLLALLLYTAQQQLQWTLASQSLVSLR